MKKNLLVTGPPGCGKTTLIETIVGKSGTPLAGFLTRKIREQYGVVLQALCHIKEFGLE